MVKVKFPRKIKWQVLSEYSYFLSVGSTREGSCADVSKFNYQKQVKRLKFTESGNRITSGGCSKGLNLK